MNYWFDGCFVLLLVSIYLFALFMEQRRKRKVAEGRYERAKAQRDSAIQQWEKLVHENLAHSRTIENASLRRQGLPIPGEKKEEPKPRKHRAVGASEKLAQYYNNQAVPVEPTRTVGPSDKVS